MNNNLQGRTTISMVPRNKSILNHKACSCSLVNRIKGCQSKYLDLEARELLSIVSKTYFHHKLTKAKLSKISSTYF